MTHVENPSQIPAHCVAAFALSSGGFDCYDTWEEVPEALKTPPLAERQARAWAQIQAYRDLLWKEGGYKVNVGGLDYWFHSDDSSKNQQLGLVIKADRIAAAGGDLAAQFASPSDIWKTMSGAYVPMNGNLARAIFDAAELQTGAIFHAAEQHRQNMLAAADPQAYDFSGGWPETYPITPL